MLVSRSTTSVTGNYINDDLEPVYVPIYPSEGSSSVSAQFAVGAGVTIPISKAYHARIEGRATDLRPPGRHRTDRLPGHRSARPRRSTSRSSASSSASTSCSRRSTDGATDRARRHPRRRWCDPVRGPAQGPRDGGRTPDPRPRRRRAVRGPRHAPAHRRQCPRGRLLAARPRGGGGRSHRLRGAGRPLHRGGEGPGAGRRGRLGHALSRAPAHPGARCAGSPMPTHAFPPAADPAASSRSAPPMAPAAVPPSSDASPRATSAQSASIASSGSVSSPSSRYRGSLTLRSPSST